MGAGVMKNVFGGGKKFRHQVSAVLSVEPVAVNSSGNDS